jgi:hypothetical protein
MKNARTNRLLQTIALSATLLLANAAAAQGSTKPADDGWVPVKHLEFTAEDVEGGLLGPDGTLILSVKRAEHRSLIEIREGFEAEIIKTMENM